MGVQKRSNHYPLSHQIHINKLHLLLTCVLGPVFGQEHPRVRSFLLLQAAVDVDLGFAQQPRVRDRHVRPRLVKHNRSVRQDAEHCRAVLVAVKPADFPVFDF